MMDMNDEYIGMMKMFAGPYTPQYYADCDGSLLSVKDNPALFGICGSRYGGNGTETFALPDMRARDAGNQPIPFGPGMPRWIICTQGLWPNPW